MKPFSARTRIIFGIVVVALIGADIWWWRQQLPVDEQAFSVDLNSLAIKYADPAALNAPTYDTKTRSWSFGDRAVHSLKPFIAQSDGFPDGIIGKYIIVRAPRALTMRDFQDTLNALVDQGVC